MLNEAYSSRTGRCDISAGLILVVAAAMSGCPSVRAHDHPDDTQGDSASHAHEQTTTAQRPATELKLISRTRPEVEAFRPFSGSVSAQEVGQHLVIESNGLPNHQMMTGIRSWQQQVPLPQPYTGENAWKLPLNPQFSSNPVSVLDEPLRGAIALAVNGVPIFSALNNRGDDTYLAGELDAWGGHCGRGDDYHYHIAPVHLEEFVGVGNPIGYALDGYPILGFTEADGSEPQGLDEFNGHKDSDGNYHYHASNTFPYINGGIRGVVAMDGDQVRQPRDSPVRPAQSPLPGATITGFLRKNNDFNIEYEVNGRQGNVRYSILDEQVRFSYVSPTGESSSAVYQRGEQGARRSIGTHWIVLLLFSGLPIAGFWLYQNHRRASGSA